MKVTCVKDAGLTKRAIGEMEAGTLFLNGANNLCMKVKSKDDHDLTSNKCAVVQLENATQYTVDKNCRYEVVQGELNYSRGNCNGQDC